MERVSTARERRTHREINTQFALEWAGAVAQSANGKQRLKSKTGRSTLAYCANQTFLS
jgi:hypothetical protein